MPSVTWHVPVEAQPPPLHPENIEPPVGAALSVTTDPDAKPVEHVAPQLMPAGADVTVPEPWKVAALRKSK